MQRDMDLIRKILFEIERASTFTVPLRIAIEEYNQDAVYYHVKLLSEAGYIHAQSFADRSRREWIPISLTWAGHEFLEAARDDTRWNKAKTVIIEQGGGMVVEILKLVLIQLAKQAVGMN